MTLVFSKSCYKIVTKAGVIRDMKSRIKPSFQICARCHQNDQGGCKCTHFASWLTLEHQNWRKCDKYQLVSHELIRQLDEWPLGCWRRVAYPVRSIFTSVHLFSQHSIFGRRNGAEFSSLYLWWSSDHIIAQYCQCSDSLQWFLTDLRLFVPSIIMWPHHIYRLLA